MMAALAAVSLQLFPGCGGETQTVTARDEIPSGTQTLAQTGVREASSLIRDASEAIDEQVGQGSGVHFTMTGATAGGGLALTSQAEGDMVFPDRMKMNTVNVAGTEPAEFEVVLVDSDVYTRSAVSSDVWQRSSRGMLPPDPRDLGSYLDFTRSSRNLGEETLRGGRKTFHLQMDIDNQLAAGDAQKRYSDPALQAAIEATRSYTVTVDMWLGVDDLLPYQMTVKVSDPASSMKSETTLLFSGWGKAIEIVRPCEAC